MPTILLFHILLDTDSVLKGLLAKTLYVKAAFSNEKICDTGSISPDLEAETELVKNHFDHLPSKQQGGTL